MFADREVVTIIVRYHQKPNETSLICLHTFKWSNVSIWPIDRTLLVTLGQGRPGNDRKERVLYILLTSPRLSLLDILVSYPEHPLVGCYRSVEISSVYSTAAADWAVFLGSFRIQSNRLRINSKHIYWTKRLDTNRLNHSGSEMTRE